MIYLWQMNTAFLYIIKFFRALQFLPFNIQITVSQTWENVWKSNIFSQIFTGIFRLLIFFWLFPAVPLGHLCWSHHYFSLLPQPLLAYFTPWPGSVLSSKMTINSRLILCCVGLSALLKIQTTQRNYNIGKGKPEIIIVCLCSLRSSP